MLVNEDEMMIVIDSRLTLNFSSIDVFVFPLTIGAVDGDCWYGLAGVGNEFWDCGVVFGCCDGGPLGIILTPGLDALEDPATGLTLSGAHLRVAITEPGTGILVPTFPKPPPCLKQNNFFF